MSFVQYHIPEASDDGKKSEPIVSECYYIDTCMSEIGEGEYQFYRDGKLIKKFKYHKGKLLSKTEYHGNEVHYYLGKLYVVFENKKMVHAKCDLKNKSLEWNRGQFKTTYSDQEEKDVLQEEKVNDELPEERPQLRRIVGRRVVGEDIFISRTAYVENIMIGRAEGVGEDIREPESPDQRLDDDDGFEVD